MPKTRLVSDKHVAKCIQAANYHAIHTLLFTGFDAQFLQTKNVQKKDVEERATTAVPNTQEQQLALANAKGHGGVYHVMRGGRNITNKELFGGRIEGCKK
jgi:hypothetical protein